MFALSTNVAKIGIIHAFMVPLQNLVGVYGGSKFDGVKVKLRLTTETCLAQKE